MVRKNLVDSVTSHLLLGFPKCGTTSLAQWLDVGPQVEVSNPKETFLLCREHRKVGAIAPEGSLDRCFSATQAKPFRLEASTRNVYSESLLEELKSLDHIKVILIFRDPVGAVTSWHNQLVQGGEAYDDSFSTCWNQSNSESIVDDIESRELNLMQNYCSVYRFGFWIHKWIAALGHERILIIRMNELSNENGHLQMRLNQFFGKELDLSTTPPVLNSYANIRFEAFYKGFKNSFLNRSLRDLERRFPMFSSIRRAAKENLFRKKISKPALEITATELANYFADDSGLADRLYLDNLRFWKSNTMPTSVTVH